MSRYQEPTPAEARAIAEQLAGTFSNDAAYCNAFEALLDKFGETFAVSADKAAELIAAQTDADMRHVESQR